MKVAYLRTFIPLHFLTRHLELDAAAECQVDAWRGSLRRVGSRHVGRARRPRLTTEATLYAVSFVASIVRSGSVVLVFGSPRLTTEATLSA